MKSILYCLLGIFALAVSAFGQAGASSVVSLTQEEVALVYDFRRNPGPYRQVLFAGVNGGGSTSVASSVVGPRDVIDVTVGGGKIAFYGKRAEYEPLSFRIARGDEIDVTFSNVRGTAQSAVRVAFRGDGLHFDIPKSYGNRTVAERGFVVVPEDARWKSGSPVVYEGTLNSTRSISEAQGIVFRIRYVSAR